MEDSRTAVISDIHGNLEAFQDVLRDIEFKNYEARRRKKGKPIERIVCLGDVVGYGPNPVECLELAIEKCSLILAGNHETSTRSKTKVPNLDLRRGGMQGRGAVEGIHWAIRQMYGDSTPVQESGADEYTAKMLENFRAEDFEARILKDACQGVGGSVPVTFTDRFSKSIAVPDSVYENFVVSRDEQLRRAFARIEAKKRGDKFVEILKNLPLDNQEGNILFTHDNDLTPGDAKYLLDESLAAIYKHSYSINRDLFERLQKRGIKYLFFGHSHAVGIHKSSEFKGVYATNTGTVGMPRFEFVSTYFILNPSAKGGGVSRVDLPLDKWEETNSKAVAAGLAPKLKLAYDQSQQETAPSGQEVLD